jgi:hypothetical protein
MFGSLKGSLILIFSLVLVSCGGKPIYTYNNVNYESPGPAIAAQKAELDTMLSKVTPTKHPVGGSAIVILPLKENVKKTIIVWKGREPSKEAKDKLGDFIATIFLNALRANGEALEKRRIFDQVVIANNGDPEAASFNDDIALLVLKKDGKYQWFIKKKKGSTSTLIAMQEISTALPPAQRLIIWLDDVEKVARSE